MNMHRIKIPHAIFRDALPLSFQTASTSKKAGSFFLFFFFSSINPSIIAFSTLALLTEPQRLDARLSDVHFIEPPGTLSRILTLVSGKDRGANIERTKRRKRAEVDVYPCRVNRVAGSGNRPLVSIKFLIKLRPRGLIRDGTNLLST